MCDDNVKRFAVSLVPGRLFYCCGQLDGGVPQRMIIKEHARHQWRGALACVRTQPDPGRGKKDADVRLRMRGWCHSRYSQPAGTKVNLCLRTRNVDRPPVADIRFATRPHAVLINDQQMAWCSEP